jgi:hypothetical protein
MLDRRQQGSRDKPASGIDDVPKRESVTDVKHTDFVPSEDQPKAAYEASRSFGATLPAPWCRLSGRVRGGPGSILVQRAAAERAEVDLVELGNDQPWHLPAGEGELERLIRPHELGRDPERDVGSREERGQAPCLLDPFRGQPLAWRGARRDAVAIRPGMGMP